MLIKRGGANMDEKLDLILEKLEKLDSLEKRMERIEMTLENVTNRNINIIAEGHADLSRKLDDAIRAGNNMELVRIRLNMLEDKVNKLMA
jgi:archaellum component FlaC